MSSAAQKRSYYRANPEFFRDRAHKFHRTNRAAILAKKAAWHRSNREVSLARSAAFRAARPSYFLEYRRAKRLRRAWLRWSTVCAASRRRMEEFT